MEMLVIEKRIQFLTSSSTRNYVACGPERVLCNYTCNSLKKCFNDSSE